jgi:hypothetical protein
MFNVRCMPRFWGEVWEVRTSILRPWKDTSPEKVWKTTCNRVRTYQRVKFKDFSRSFKTIYQQIQALNTEKALEISTISRWIVQNATLVNFIQLCQIWSYKINATKCPFLCQIISENIHKLKQEEFKDFQAFLYKFQDIQGLEFFKFKDVQWLSSFVRTLM